MIESNYFFTSKYRQYLAIDYSIPTTFFVNSSFCYNNLYNKTRGITI